MSVRQMVLEQLDIHVEKEMNLKMSNHSRLTGPTKTGRRLTRVHGSLFANQCLVQAETESGHQGEWEGGISLAVALSPRGPQGTLGLASITRLPPPPHFFPGLCQDLHRQRNTDASSQLSPGLRHVPFSTSHPPGSGLSNKTLLLKESHCSPEVCSCFLIKKVFMIASLLRTPYKF